MHVALVVTAAPLADRAAEVAQHLASAGHQVTVCPTAAAKAWLTNMDPAQILAGRIRPDAVVVCPGTFNTLNKWAAGINDSDALGVLNDALGLDTPVLVVPMAADRLAAHPAWTRTGEILTAAGVAWLDPGSGALVDCPVAHPSGAGDPIATNFQPEWLLPWLTDSRKRTDQ